MTVSRRTFLGVGAAAGAGLVIGVYFHEKSQSGPDSFAPNAYLRITNDGAITVLVARSEMGQGVRTSLPMILAEELDADWKQIHIEQAPTDSVYGDQMTGGSASIRVMWDPMRKAGAAAREMLVSAAAAEWGVQRSECRSESGNVIHNSGRKLAYGKLVARAAKLPVPTDPPLKDGTKYRCVGQPIARLDIPGKVDGTAQFGIDFRLPGMKYALLARCPVIGGKVASFDDKETRKATGVAYVGKVSDAAVAVVADNVWSAMEGRRVLNVQWDEGPNRDLNTAATVAQLKSSASKHAATLYSAGDVSKVSGHRIESEYQLPWMAHAAMEPGNTTAHFHGDSCEIWSPTQNPQEVQKAVAQALGISDQKVKVNVLLMGGGFGRRLEHDYAVEAALVSKAANAPVQVLWTREDDMRNSTYRPASYHKLSAVLDGHGLPIAFHHRFVSPSINMQKGFPGPTPDVDGDLPDEGSLIYSLPNAQVEYVMTESPVPLGYMRSVYALQVGFASEAFIDELAAMAKKDPLEYRLQLLAKDEEIKFFDTTWKTARMRGVLQLAADKAGWGKPPAGRYQGIACFGCFGTYAAEVVEISMENDQPRVHRVVAALDCGRVVNPNILEQQIQGAVHFALANALRAQITIEKGCIVQGNFDDYQPMRINEVPAVEAYFVQSSESPTGAGEPPVPPLAPALSNAIYAATKKRIRQLPILS